MSTAYIVDAVRTAGGKRGGKVAGWHPVDLAAVTLDALGLPATPAEDALEAFDTFEANALAKARHFAALSYFAAGQFEEARAHLAVLLPLQARLTPVQRGRMAHLARALEAASR